MRLSDYSETSQVATVFGAGSGLLRLMAKGMRRGTKQRFAAGLDLLEYGELRFAPPKGDAGLGALFEWRQRDSFAGLRRDLLRLYAGLYAAELVTATTVELDPNPELFAALLELLEQLAAVEMPEGAAAAGRVIRPPAAAIVRFQFRLLAAIGLKPQLRQCAVCGKPRAPGGPASFSFRAGGYVCPTHARDQADRRSLRPEMIDQRPQTGLELEWFHVLDDALRQVAGKALQTSALIANLLARRPSNPA